MYAILFLLCVALQGAAPQTPQPQPHHQTPHWNTWHTFHQRPLIEVNRLLASPLIVVSDPNQVYAQVTNGVVVQTYRLVPVTTVVEPVVVPERRGGWFFRYRR